MRELKVEEQVNWQVDIELDVRGLTCPLPLLKAKQALNRLEVGEIVKVLASDPGSERDFHVFAEQSGILLLDFHKSDGEYSYYLKKG